MTRVRATESRLFRARVESSHALRGVRAGSGVVRVGDHLLVVQDDAFAVARVDLRSFDVSLVALVADGRALEKREKPDFECAVERGHRVWLLGSGSTDRRTQIAQISLAGELVGLVDRAPLYDALQAALDLAHRPNVEGATIGGDRLRLFHRGAGGAASAVVDFDVDVLEGAPPVARTTLTIDLGDLEGVPLSWTDATASADATFFLAAAEDTDNAVDDGAVAGSVLGRLRGSLAEWTPLVDADGVRLRCKAEGLVVDADGRGAWVVTDPDDPRIAADLLRVVIDASPA